MFVNFAILMLGLAFLRWGYDFGVLASRQRSEIFGLPMLSIYIAWPLAGLTWVIFVVERGWDDLASYRASA
jgi:TRAP-type C4-dicarboxylate transport system permease small subunit